jgi:hypothetical protein
MSRARVVVAYLLDEKAPVSRAIALNEDDPDFDADEYMASVPQDPNRKQPAFMFTFSGEYGADDGCSERLKVPWEVLAPFGITDFAELDRAWRPPDPMLEDAVIEYAQEHMTAEWDFLAAVDFFIEEQ